MGRTWLVSPIEILIEREVVEVLAELKAPPIVRRVLALVFACSDRGRGRIPNALREEARVFDRAVRIIALMHRESADPRQSVFPFLETIGETLPWRWSAAFDPGLSTRERDAIRDEIVEAASILCVGRVEWQAGRAGRIARARVQRRTEQHRLLRPVERLLRTGDMRGALAALRRLSAIGGNVPPRIRALVLAGDRSTALHEIRNLCPDTLFGAAA